MLNGNGVRSHEQVGAEELLRVLKIIGSHRRAEEIALRAYVHAMMAQVENQTVVDFLLHKNFFGSAEFRKCLGDRYLEMAKQLEQRQLLVPAFGTIVR